MYPSLLTALAVTLGAPAPKIPKPHPIVGTWLILSHTQDGRTFPIRGDHCWTFTADGRRGGHTLSSRPTGWIKYELDDRRQPPALYVTHEPGSGPQIESFVYEIDGDTLRFGQGIDGGLPKSISGEAGSGAKVYTLRRVKAKE
jgi:hypothetical protein